ncbi:type VI secretion system tube protein Hcp [Rhodovulum sp. DZ06]|uniref:type VI secretion system tube protein Hcp n=1 Tax=Rhodovulum sp. DZ06 TaxID=3425126 RepID=UPI003D343F95
MPPYVTSGALGRATSKHRKITLFVGPRLSGGDVPEILGESRFQHDAMDLYDFNWGEEYTGTWAVGGGGSAGVAAAREIEVLKEIDKASPALLQACFVGGVYETAQLKVFKAGGATLEYVTFHLENVSIRSYDIITDDPSEKLKETLRLGFARLRMTYRVQGNLGAVESEHEGGIDVQANTAW